MKDKNKDVLKGLLMVLAIAIVTMLLNHYFLSFIETLTIGILIGMLYANTIGVHKALLPGVNFSLKKLLKWGIVLMGVKLDFYLLATLGPKMLILVILVISCALIASYFLGKKFKLNKKLATLLGVGSSICGASAIVAMGPVIDANDEDVAISVTVISLLGAIGVIIYSLISNIAPLNDVQYGLWAGTSLQGVAHALAAAGARGSDSLSMEVGTLVKMARVVFLAPVAIVLSYLFQGKGSDKRKKVQFPMYVLWFIIVGVLFTLNKHLSLVPTSFIAFSKHIDVVETINALSNLFILMAMIAMGLKVNLKAFESKAIRSLFACSLLFILLSGISLLFILTTVN